MSDLLNSLYAKLEPKRYAKRPDAAPPKERWAIGMALEEGLEESFKRRFVLCAQENQHSEWIERPGEMETEHTDTCLRKNEDLPPGCGCRCGGGVLYSPDLLILNAVTRVGEIKLNSMSAKGAPWRLGETYTGFDTKFDKYFDQVRLYCKHLKTVYGRLYSFSMREMVYFNEKDIFRGWDVQFTQHELDETWEWTRRHGVEEGILT